MKLPLTFRDKESGEVFEPHCVVIGEGEVKEVTAIVGDTPMVFSDSEISTGALEEIQLITQGRTKDQIISDILGDTLLDHKGNKAWTMVMDTGKGISLSYGDTPVASATNGKELLSLIISEWMDIMEGKV